MKQMQVASLWQQVPHDLDARLRHCLDEAVERADGPVTVFFRADDIGVPGAGFDRLMQLFATRRVPLNLALVPAWLTRVRWQAVLSSSRGAPGLWCWHQHGWRHANHESEGKKQELMG